jgi:hypothetical protein
MEERKELIKTLKDIIRDDINNVNNYIHNINNIDNTDFDDITNSIYHLIFYPDFEIITFFNIIKDLEQEQEIEEAKWHQQYPMNLTEIKRLQYVIKEYIKKQIPIKYRTNYDNLIYYIYDLLEKPNEEISELITNINIKSNEICDNM